MKLRVLLGILRIQLTKKIKCEWEMHDLRSNKWKHMQQSEGETGEMCKKRDWEVGLSSEHVAGVPLCSVALTAVPQQRGGWQTQDWNPVLEEATVAFVIRACSRGCRRRKGSKPTFLNQPKCNQVAFLHLQFPVSQ